MSDYQAERSMILKDISDNREEIRLLREKLVNHRITQAKVGAAGGGVTAVILFMLELIFRG